MADEIAALFPGSVVTYDDGFRARWQGREFTADTPNGIIAQLQILKDQQQVDRIRRR
jgi:hypothetical protein